MDEAKTEYSSIVNINLIKHHQLQILLRGDTRWRNSSHFQSRNDSILCYWPVVLIYLFVRLSYYFLFILKSEWYIIVTICVLDGVHTELNRNGINEQLWFKLYHILFVCFVYVCVCQKDLKILVWFSLDLCKQLVWQRLSESMSRHHYNGLY